jgi:hypothetical protein
MTVQLLPRVTSVFLLAWALLCRGAAPQTEKAPQIPAQIELLETSVRFETNGDSRKEVHALVKINNELGVRQFARLNFDFNRSFQSVEIPLARITHAKGGITDILPSAIADNPNPAVVNFPAYQDVRVKSIRILGLAPGDMLEYRVVTTTKHHPLAPDFWLDHRFDRTGVVSREIFQISVPEPHLKVSFSPDLPPAKLERSGEGESARVSYAWDLRQSDVKGHEGKSSRQDIALTTFSSWSRLSQSLYQLGDNSVDASLYQEASTRLDTTGAPDSPESLYEFVSRKITTVDLPLELSLSVRRSVHEIVQSGYGTAAEKVRLLSALLEHSAPGLRTVMYGETMRLEDELPRPSLLSGSLLELRKGTRRFFLDPGLEVAPFGLVRADVRKRQVLLVGSVSGDTNDCFTRIPEELPFASAQYVSIDALLSREGELRAKVKYAMRGDNELVLRLAFHQSPKEKWNEVAQLLALSDGFRGKVTSVTATDPYATRDPFRVEYEVVQPRFVDWSRTPVRIPAILPLLGLPDPPSEPGKAPIELGTPLEVQTSVTLHLPPGTSVEAPAGTSVERDYATFSSQYASANGVISASRHIHFIEPEIAADRAADYNAFLHAVQNDQAQRFALFPAPARDSAQRGSASVAPKP